MTDITTLIFNPEELEEWLDNNTCSPLTADEMDELSAMWEHNDMSYYFTKNKTVI